MQNRLIICEKPSVAASIAAALEVTDRKDGFFMQDGWIVSWCYGHLVELAPPGAYGDQYKRWNRAALPILPEAWKYVASEKKKKQLDILRALMNRADVISVICATDAGREGQLIFQLVYDYCKCKKTVQRLWISSLEDSAIREGFARMRPNSDYDNLYRSALCRAQADWTVGMNASRLVSCLYGATLSVGRVQSPTLALIAEREAEIAAFKSEPFYTPEIDIGSFIASGERMSDRDAAERVRVETDGRNATVLSIEKTRKTVAPPKLYDLTTLQREANRLFGYTAQQTLDYAQSLYEKRLITYPRTDARFITADMRGTVAGLIGDVDFTPDLDAIVGPVSDHHAILPTEEVTTADLSALPAGERDILNMIITRLICAVAPAHVYEAVTVTLECGDQQFTAKGKTALESGWKAVDEAFRSSLKNAPDEDRQDEHGDAVLPEISEGQMFPSVTVSIRESKTSPPARYTDDSLLRAMETEGAEETPDDTDHRGLGTPATRAGMIEKLVKSGYISRQKRQTAPTEKGLNLIAILPDEIKSPLLTATWEERLRQVERGELTGPEFMAGIEALVRGLVAAHSAPIPEYASLFAQPPKGETVGKCLRCGAPVTENGKGFFCSNRACRFALWRDNRFFEAKGKKIDKATAAALLTEGRVFFSDLKSERTGKSYAAAILLDDTGDRVQFKLEVLFFSKNEEEGWKRERNK